MGQGDRAVPGAGVRGRGAVRNVKGRFERYEVEPFDDGWPGGGDGPARLRTTLMPDRARTILTTNDSPDVPFEVSLNPYRGCEHGCSYCFARATHAWLGLSPGLDFETKIFFKPDAARLLREALCAKSYRCRPIAMGTNTDPYQPAERRLRLTRQVLEILAEHRHPVSIVTKSDLVLRDLDLLAPMAGEDRAAVYLSITTLDPALARTMEPRAAAPSRRLRAIEGLSEAGVPTGVLASPMIPGLNDTELERVLEAAQRAGARRGGYLLLRLPHEVRQVFLEWLRNQFPGKAERVLAQLRAMHGGELYDPTFGRRSVGGGAFADLLRRRFEIACRRLDLNEDRFPLDTTAFRVPGRAGSQQRLFD